jgi:hypothetical protein
MLFSMTEETTPNLDTWSQSMAITEPYDSANFPRCTITHWNQTIVHEKNDPFNNFMKSLLSM